MSIPHRRYFFGGAFQPLAAIILRARFQLSMNGRRTFWLAAGACIALAVLAAAGTSVWMSRFLRGEAFRKLIASETGEVLASEVVSGPLRWTGSSLFADSLQATGLPGSVVETLHADQVRADVNWRAIFGGAWRVDRVQVVSVEGTFRPGSTEPNPVEMPHKPAAWGLAALLPKKFEVGQVDIAKSRVRFLASDGLEIASLQDSALRIYPDGGGWAIEGSGGVLALAKAPALNVVSFRSRIQGDVYFLTDAQFRLGETGRISASGEFSSNSKLRIEWNQVDVTLFLDPVWRSRLSGKLAGTAALKWPESGPGSGEAGGNFRLTDGLAQNMDLLDRIATFTGAPQFRRMPLQEVSGNFEWTKGALRITNLVAESKGLLRLEGTCTVTTGGTIDGTLQVGVTPQTLQWLPGSRERVFSETKNGYVWTTVRISGSLRELREDLSSRLVAAMQDEVIDRGTRAIKELPNAAKEGAQGVLDALAPMIK